MKKIMEKNIDNHRNVCYNANEILLDKISSNIYFGKEDVVMKKILAFILCVLTVAGLMTSCAGSDGFKDGKYRIEAAAADDHGWKEYIDVTVSGGKNTAVDFDSVNEEDGRLKSEDEDFKAAYVGAGFETYPADYSDNLETGLIENQDAEKVDSVAGATTSSTSFKAMMKELQKAMKQGKTDTIIYKAK